MAVFWTQTHKDGKSWGLFGRKKVSIKMTVTTNNLSATNNIYLFESVFF